MSFLYLFLEVIGVGRAMTATTAATRFFLRLGVGRYLQSPGRAGWRSLDSLIGVYSFIHFFDIL